MIKDKLRTAGEIADILGLSVETIWRYTREKKIPYLEIGGKQYRYKEDEVLAALKTGKVVLIEQEATYSSKLTYKDYARQPAEPGYTIELIDGVLIRAPSPTVQHQRVSIRLQTILLNYYTKLDPHAEILNAPLDLYLDEHTVVQPDLLLFTGDNLPHKTPVRTRPQLVVEILSPSSSRIDRVEKLNHYQEAKITHYWIVDPQDKLIECYQLKKEGYLSVARFSEGHFNHPSFPGLNFRLEKIFYQPPQT
ncbi:MAG: helix-turn-helix domain-containing protein [Firmicutes bacterium]|nr:helix-turn-helix domain-containing protein [Bacillota bacterium]